ncbi:ParB N-terminal domain-containing protein [Aestuariivita sp.]|jgi:ParB family chromosome partitioning protein|uniref:ParB N-terminal domain-containing protein n=1 Tax=Aestuariivita sp. TaxID=1872407 RepID=UPI00216E0D47|nr:ParB N-terminal domain-containing protein [Aestuariivita sp.]MCE8007091.1 ParB N-terminal domain-containing protein [Aestuariivita sp.]
MAKRRRVAAPSAEELQKIEEEFRHETSPGARGVLGPDSATAPIAQVAAESAARAELASPEARIQEAELRSEVRRLEKAEAEGRLMADLPVAEIEADGMVRDRTVLEEGELTELQLSIAANGLRLPIEVYELPEPREDGLRYALISGYRRVLAVRRLRELTGQDAYDRIRAIVRPGSEADAAFIAMVEENEVRADLSHFERGRVAVIAAQQGAFANVEDAVNRLFATGSKAKRSKVRSFAVIFEELGDMLEYPEALTEKRGLRLAQILRQGGERQLREALARGVPANAEDEWSMLDNAIAAMEEQGTPTRNPSRGGRPRRGKPISNWVDAESLVTSAGITIRKQRDEAGFLLRFEGRGLDDELMTSLMQEIRALLEKT